MTQEEIKSNFSKNLIRLRKSHNLTQLQLAEQINYSDKAISKWEVGSVLPDIETMITISEFLPIRRGKPFQIPVPLEMNSFISFIL